jgi:hypothetical protein
MLVRRCLLHTSWAMGQLFNFHRAIDPIASDHVKCAQLILDVAPFTTVDRDVGSWLGVRSEMKRETCDLQDPTGSSGGERCRGSPSKIGSEGF